MKTLILYESRKGYTKKCAEYLYEKIKDSDLFDIEEGGFELKGYDNILIGAPIYVGEIEKFTRDFIEKNKNILLDFKLGLFCSGMNKVEFNIAVQDSIPVEIFYHAKIVFCGGVIEYKKLSLSDKCTIWRRLKIRKSQNDEHFEALDVFVNMN